jgi:predicted lipoprotein with Yx(FWY)xxD motif
MAKFVTILAITAVAVALVGCGGGSSSPTTTAFNAAVIPGTEFSTAKVPGVGTVVIDRRGRTVYILTSASKKNVPCTDANGCTALWPNLAFPNGTSSALAGKGIDSSLLGQTKLSDGETYPTYNGYLMYEYTGDTGRGQANGQGLKSFGGTWYVLNPSGQPVKASSSGGGYGGYP